MPRPMNDRAEVGSPKGRKPISKTGELMKPRQMRMTDAEWEKCKRLGGAAWVRKQIGKAKEKP
jgi:hypothetical protein